MPHDPVQGVDDARAFAQAIVDTIREPLLVLDSDLRVIVASRAFYNAFKVGQAETEGRLLRELGGGEWHIPALSALLERVAPEDGVIEAYEVDSVFPGIGHRIMLMNARKVFYEGRNATSILVAIEDITARRQAERERDELVAQKEMLLGEMQHRVANSLQIIASILLLKARTVGSEETRSHLEDAHKRVLAVAAVQRHLHAVGGEGAVSLEPYLEKLCESLEGAMIQEGRVRLEVEVASGAATSDIAVSIGLIVTELVINALKHAFPVEGPNDLIVVSYVPVGSDWTLTVSDNGVGKEPAPAAPFKGGLGASIVAALAEQLGAEVSTVTGAHGTSVSIKHRQAA
jgi:chemotaxis protein methyltransferase CheR